MKKLCNIMLVPLITFTVVTLVAFAQAESLLDVSPNPNHIKKRLTEKYKKVRDVSSTLFDTPNGPKGHLDIGGEMKPETVPVVEGEYAWERGMARGFIEQEASTFGIADVDEVKERKVVRSVGYYGDITNVYFHRVINGLVLEHSDFNVTVDTIRNISSVVAEVVPAPPELYEATKKPTLAEEKIRSIIENDLKAANSVSIYKINRLEKLATYTLPYVVWNADVISKDSLGRWKFRIDAFTGEILEKRNALVSNNRPVK